MSKKEWGPACWLLFHGLASKVKEEEFDIIKFGIWEQINGICNNLPCPECREHATELMAKTNKNAILISKRNLELFLFDFHNLVNKRTYSKIMTIEEYDTIYKNVKLIPIINNFISKFIVSTRNNKLMLDVMHRHLFSGNFTRWMKQNINRFYLD
jgi:hypothetical protein